MQVNVFVARVDGKLSNDLLVLPLAPHSAIPDQYQDHWKYYATVETGDRIFGDVVASAIEAEIGKVGFAVVTPTVPDRR
ncbi:MAG: hypothetical protein WBA73_11580 [Devosia sp.]